MALYIFLRGFITVADQCARKGQDLKAKLERAHFSKVQSGKITV